jgi:hypothetical protein
MKKEMDEKYRYFRSYDLREKDVKEMAAIHQSFLFQSIKRKIRPITKYLISFGLTNQELKKVIMSHPEIYDFSLQNLKNQVRYFRSKGLEKDDIKKIIKKNVVVLGYKTRNKPRLNLFSSYGCSRSTLRKLLIRYPQIMGLSIRLIKDRLDYLIERGGTDIDLVINKHPQIVSYDIYSTMKPKLAYFWQKGFRRKAITTILYRTPTLMGLNLENNIKPTYDRLIDIGLTPKEIRKNPGLLRYSLEERINPRAAFLKKKHLVRSPSYYLSQTDRYFAETIAQCNVIEYERFKKRYMKAA